MRAVARVRLPRSALLRAAWQRRRLDREARPFPSPWRRIRSAGGLVVVTVALGFATAMALGGLFALLLLAGSHLLDG